MSASLVKDHMRKSKEAEEKAAEESRANLVHAVLDEHEEAERRCVCVCVCMCVCVCACACVRLRYSLSLCVCICLSLCRFCSCFFPSLCSHSHSLWLSLLVKVHEGDL